MSESAYRTVVVGTDGSESSLRAVARAGALAGATGATLVIACAYLPGRGRRPGDGPGAGRARRGRVPDRGLPPGRGHRPDGAGAGRARPAPKDVKTVAVEGSPVEALLDVVRRENADLLVVGNRGLAGIKGRLLGSVPADATRRSQCDVLVVHTTG